MYNEIKGLIFDPLLLAKIDTLKIGVHTLKMGVHTPNLRLGPPNLKRGLILQLLVFKTLFFYRQNPLFVLYTII